ncbi:Methyltransferase type 11 [Micractinium conductrix]|uniref:Methyltransferase type 11 n=1 Tax=Micractinium conductrix TaxID=554055 RepID=A0A2P6V207_9CHLO|nr:Methyltransferase type 11 [Micractinium conductrix]|eukprot:PSC68120.1 Methyltransferase type 11 [Micractinium conductrix]
MMAAAVRNSASNGQLALAAGTTPRRRRPAAAPRRTVAPTAQASSSSTVSGVEDKDKPDWTGNHMLSRIVNAAINFKPLFALMKVGASSVMKSTAEKRGVAWGETVDALSKSEVYQIKEEIEDKAMVYPSYYTVPFHGYDTGNLSWLAAFEVEPAGEVMALRVWKTEEQLTPLQAQTRLRKAIYDSIKGFMAQHSLAAPRDMIDVGCSVGVSTRWLAAEWPQAAITGLDMSPYFLAVAELRERQLGGGAGQRQRIRYMHANMESTGLPAGSFDLVAVQFVTHECPAAVIENLIRECRRLLRPGGVLAIVDNNPRSKVIQNLPPVLFTLMKSTEPHTDEYYGFDIEDCMRAHDFQHVNTVESDPRHRVVLGHL